MKTFGIGIRIFFIFLSSAFTNQILSQCTLPICTQDDCGPVNVGFNPPSGGVSFCEDALVPMVNTSTTDFTYYVIDWSDGTIDTTYTKDTIFHQYHVPDSVLCNGNQGLQVCFIGVLKCGGNNTSCAWGSYGFALKVRPKAIIYLETQYCSDNLINFINLSCNADTYSWDFGDGQTSSDENPTHIYNLPGNYLITLSASNECGTDIANQIVTIIDFPDLQITQSENVLTTNTPPGDIQWGRCENGFEPILGATDSIYQVLESGSYAYAYSLSNCSDISSCVFVEFTDVLSVERSMQLTLYPNPTSGLVHISYPINLDVKEITVWDVYGFEQNLTKENESTFSAIDFTLLKPGLYFIKLVDKNNKQIILKIIKL